MSPNGISSGFDEIFLLSSSESSDSESILQEDIKINDNDYNKQWEAIERTLYQEPGAQVTDSELLKECKLWRETFPHFRVKGTKLDVKQTDVVREEKDESLQTLENHFNIKKLEEKREIIKNKVVGLLVDRLIAKYGSDKGSANSDAKGGVEISEIDDDSIENFLNASPKSPKRHSETLTPFTTDTESYFERGKQQRKDTTLHGYKLQSYRPKEVLPEEQKEKNFYGTWEKEFKNAKELTKAYERCNFPNAMTHDYPLTGAEKQKRKKTPLPNSLLDATKPFEMSTKISKKYEGLVDRIFDRKSYELETMRHCRSSASRTEMKNMHDSLQKLRIGSSLEDYLKRNRMPRINKFDNNWLRRSETDFIHRERFPLKNSPNSKSNFYHTNSPNEINEKFLEDLKKEMDLNYKRPSRRSGNIEQTSIRKPKPLPLASGKALSCGDFQRKETKGRKFKTEPVKNESNLKKGTKQNHLNAKGIKSNGNQILPPIETGIICTELTGRPRVRAKIPPKRD